MEWIFGFYLFVNASHGCYGRLSYWIVPLAWHGQFLFSVFLDLSSATSLTSPFQKRLLFLPQSISLSLLLSVFLLPSISLVPQRSHFSSTSLLVHAFRIIATAYISLPKLSFGRRLSSGASYAYLPSPTATSPPSPPSMNQQRCGTPN